MENNEVGKSTTLRFIFENIFIYKLTRIFFMKNILNSSNVNYFYQILIQFKN